MHHYHSIGGAIGGCLVFILLGALLKFIVTGRVSALDIAILVGLCLPSMLGVIIMLAGHVR